MKLSPTEVTNTSPRAMKAISLPLGETAISLTPPLMEMNLSLLALSWVMMVTGTFLGCPPSFMVYSSPS